MQTLACFGLLLVSSLAPGAAGAAPSDADSSSPRENVWIFFTDKAIVDRDAALGALESHYEPRAIERRRLRRTAPGLFDERDLPLDRSYVEAVARTGARVRVESTWLNAISASATADELDRIVELGFVADVQPVRSLRTAPLPDVTDVARAPQGASGFYGLSFPQLQQMNLVALHNAGFTGDGVVIGVLDTGFRRSHQAYTHPSHPLDVVAEWDFVNGDGNTAPEPGDLPNQHDHGTWILGTMGAYDPGNLMGGAYDAGFVLAKVEDVAAEYGMEEDYFVAGLQFIEAQGGDVATSSVVIYDTYDPSELDGKTSVMAQGLNAAAENGLHCLQGAGNEGHDNDPNVGHLVPPADAFLVLSVGAVNSGGATANFSSDGPTADGRVKPEVLARGVATWTTHSNNASGGSQLSGTSLATPLVAATVACLVQAHPDWTVGQMRAALLHTADHYVANGEPDPLVIRGYGIVDAFAAAQELDPLVYCTPKKTSVGCLPSMSFDGAPSATASSGFDVTAALLRNHKAALSLYGLAGPAALPFQGGTLCLAPPVHRGPTLDAGGNPPPADDCSGLYRADMNAFAAGLLGGSPQPELRQPGTRVHLQIWGRDAQAANGSSLSDALEYTVGP